MKAYFWHKPNRILISNRKKAIADSATNSEGELFANLVLKRCQEQANSYLLINNLSNLSIASIKTLQKAEISSLIKWGSMVGESWEITGNLMGNCKFLSHFFG